MIPRQLPLPKAPELGVPGLTLMQMGALVTRYVRDLHVRLTNWVADVSDAHHAQVLSHVALTPPDFTCPYTIDTDATGLPKALLCVGSAVVPATLTDPPEAGRWLLRQTANGQQIVFGTAPDANAFVFFAFLVARRS